MFQIRRIVAAVASAVLLAGAGAAPAQAVTSLGAGQASTQSFRICDFIPFFPGCPK